MLDAVEDEIRRANDPEISAPQIPDMRRVLKTLKKQRAKLAPDQERAGRRSAPSLGSRRALARQRSPLDGARQSHRA